MRKFSLLLANHPDVLAKLRSFSLYKYLLHKMQIEKFDRLVNGAINHIKLRHENYISWKGKSLRGVKRLLDDIYFDCVDYLSYDYDGKLALLNSLYSHICFIISCYCNDQEDLELGLSQSESADFIDYENVPEEEKQTISLRGIGLKKISEPEEEIIKESTKDPDLDEGFHKAPPIFLNKAPSKKFLEPSMKRLLASIFSNKGFQNLQNRKIISSRYKIK